MNTISQPAIYMLLFIAGFVAGFSVSSYFFIKLRKGWFAINEQLTNEILRLRQIIKRNHKGL